MKVIDKKIITIPNTPVYDIINALPNNNFLIPTISGKSIVSHNCAVLDEIDFAKGSNMRFEQSKIMDTVSAVKKRITSRFIKNGVCVGKLFLVSSKKSEYDFLESYVRKIKADPEESTKMYVVDAPLWDVKPKGTYSGKMFKVAVGNKLLTSQIISNNATEEQIDSLIKQGYEIMEVPVEFRGDFITDINRALMDIAGRAVIGTTSFFNYELFKKCYIESYKNPFTSDILQIGLHDNLNIKDFFKIDDIPEQVRNMPHYIHIDTSLTGDKTGISDVAISGKKKSIQYAGSQEIESEELCYKHVFTVGIKAPQGSEISLEKTRQFVYFLRASGFNIVGVSLDGFQSADSRQIFETQGFNSSLLSLDKTPDGYVTTRSAMNDGRIGLIHIEPLETELVQLQRDNVTGKIDHPVDGCFTGDTKIRLVDGRSITINELLLEQQYKQNWVYTVNENTKQIEPKPIEKVFQTKLTKHLLTITLDNGKFVQCTPNHRFMLRDGSFCEAQNLTPETSLMSLYTKVEDKVPKNHKIVSIEYINKPCRVYDLQIKDNHNFALDCGVFVHNSKDLSDSLGGAVWNASKHKEDFIMDLELMGYVADLNATESEQDKFKETFKKQLEQQAHRHSQQAADALDELLNGDTSIIAW